MKRVEEYDQRQARLRNYFIKQDYFWSFRDWPQWAQDTALKEHKRYRERYRLYLFWTFNGLDPATAVDWLTARDYTGGALIAERYDRGAWSQIYGMQQQIRDGTFYKGISMYDMITGRPETTLNEV